MTRATPRAASLGRRMLLGAVLWIGVALAAGGWVLVDLFRGHVEAQAREALVLDMDQVIAGLAVGPDGALTVERPPSDPRFGRPLSGFYWQVGVPPEVRSRSLWDAALALPPDLPQDGEVHLHRLTGPRGAALLTAERRITLPEREAPVVVAVAHDAAAVEAAVGRFTRDLSVAFVVLGGALVLAAAAQGAAVLHPLRRLRRQVLDVRRGRADRLAGSFPAEVTPLVDDLNALLDHERETVARARRQAGDLAHGLKTPLAVIAAEAQDLGGAGHGEAAAVLAEQVEAMRRQVEANLARARAAAARDLPGIRAPVAATLEPLARAVGRLNDRPVTVAVPPDLAFRGDAQDLQEMAGNLIDNAAKWAATQVTVTAAALGPERLEIVVDDDGPGLPADQRAAVFDRGRRLDESVPGTGLGLAIARDLARLYGGEVALDDAPGGGCRAVLRLPRSASPAGRA
ncbi:ATP-binding protein [Caenispirillum bisanense]|uniref:histidine kinase n=1 Tax=Caenispirillum bisanense TaxID=414052 RepID=A0A286GBN5_9PROT|nr:ATP-binding protein [Caenispirillum bisanense]SOD92414.1 Signal transduction histidine kinase [Caenispirillum bisanense]